MCSLKFAVLVYNNHIELTFGETEHLIGFEKLSFMVEEIGFWPTFLFSQKFIFLPPLSEHFSGFKISQNDTI